MQTFQIQFWPAQEAWLWVEKFKGDLIPALFSNLSLGLRTFMDGNLHSDSWLSLPTDCSNFVSQLLLQKLLELFNWIEFYTLVVRQPCNWYNTSFQIWFLPLEIPLMYLYKIKFIWSILTVCMSTLNALSPNFWRAVSHSHGARIRYSTGVSIDFSTVLVKLCTIWG